MLLLFGLIPGATANCSCIILCISPNANAAAVSNHGSANISATVAIAPTSRSALSKKKRADELVKSAPLTLWLLSLSTARQVLPSTQHLDRSPQRPNVLTFNVCLNKPFALSGSQRGQSAVLRSVPRPEPCETRRLPNRPLSKRPADAKHSLG